MAVLYEGVLGGSVYANAFYFISAEVWSSNVSGHVHMGKLIGVLWNTYSGWWSIVYVCVVARLPDYGNFDQTCNSHTRASPKQYFAFIYSIISL